MLSKPIVKVRSDINANESKTMNHEMNMTISFTKPQGKVQPNIP